MNDSEAWANAILCGHLLLRGHVPRAQGNDAGYAVSEVTGNVVLCGAPIEIFSDKKPAFFPESQEEDGLLPIDVIYGQYNAETKTIEIFVENIRRDYSIFGGFDELLYLIRVHEHAHAIVHLGLSEEDLPDTLHILGTEGITNWIPFTKERTDRFYQIDSPAHEFLAQTITYAVALRHPVSDFSERLRDVFLKLEDKQPKKYLVPDNVKKSIDSINWPTLLNAARGNPKIYQGPNFNLLSGLQILALR